MKSAKQLNHQITKPPTVTEKEFETIAPQLRALMLSIGRDFFGNDMDAEDIAQDGLVALWKYCQKMDVTTNHKALAVRIAKHCCMDLVRKRKNIIPLYNNKEEEIAPPGASTSPSPQDELEAAELHTAVNDAIGHLKPSERRLFELRQIEGKSLDEIAEETKITKPSVKSIISTARKKVFEELKLKLKR